MKLYHWQHECISAWENNHFHGIAHVATGAGKTFMSLNAIDRYRSVFPDARIKIVVPTIPLARQWLTALLHHTTDNQFRPGFFGGGKHDDPDSPVMIYIINSARDHLSKHIKRDFSLGRHVLLICDECHHYQAEQNRKIFDFIHTPYASGSQYASLGLSATPFGAGNDRILLDALGPEIYHYDVLNAIADEIVTDFAVCNVSVSFLPEERAEYERLSYELMLARIKLLNHYPELKELSPHAFLVTVNKLAQAAGMDPENSACVWLMTSWKRKECSVLAQARLLCAASLVGALPDDRRILIFCERIRQAEQLSSLLRRKFGNICALYHSEMSIDARQRNMSDFQRNHCRILVSCRCLDEGIDVPDADVGIVLSGSTVSRQRIQRLGRILRKSDNKPQAALYYLYIQESADDAAFLQGLEDNKSISLQFNSLENYFSNSLYEYAAMELLNRAKKSDAGNEQIKEIRKCLVEGLTRTDYLLKEEQIDSLITKADTTHERNYWKTMKKMGQLFKRT